MIESDVVAELVEQHRIEFVRSQLGIVRCVHAVEKTAVEHGETLGDDRRVEGSAGWTGKTDDMLIRADAEEVVRDPSIAVENDRTEIIPAYLQVGSVIRHGDVDRQGSRLRQRDR